MITATKALAGRQRHPHPPKVYLLGNEHLGRQPHPGAGPRRLAAQPSNILLPSCRVGTTLYRLLRINREHTVGPLQRQMARPHMRRHRLPTPTECRMATRSKLMQPTVGSTVHTMRKITLARDNDYRYRITLASQTVVPTTSQHGDQNHPLPRSTRPLFLGQRGSRAEFG
jgi:hypothetical protein